MVRLCWRRRHHIILNVCLLKLFHHFHTHTQTFLWRKCSLDSVAEQKRQTPHGKNLYEHISSYICQICSMHKSIWAYIKLDPNIYGIHCLAYTIPIFLHMCHVFIFTHGNRHIYLNLKKIFIDDKFTRQEISAVCLSEPHLCQFAVYYNSQLALVVCRNFFNVTSTKRT